ncbi:5817_t:CDS:2, partial [Cetraspora pellucida]
VPELNIKKKSTDTLKNEQSNHREQFDQGKLVIMIKQWIIKHNRPFFLVEDDGFKLIISYLEPEAKVPSADSIKRHLMNVFEYERGIIQKKLQEVPGGVSLTTDIWTTSTYEKSFMAITIHFLDSSWHMKHLLLDFVHMDGAHTGAAISNSFEECLQSMGVISKLVAITHDNASSNITFLSIFSNSVRQNGIQFDDTQQSIRCFGHILNLAMQSLLGHIGNEVEKLRTLIKSIRGSRILRKKFKIACQINNINVLKPILDTTT